MSFNPYTRLRKLIPGDPEIIATVAAVNQPAGTAIVELPGGALVTVRGDGAVGQLVHVKGGVITGSAQAPVGVVHEE